VSLPASSSTVVVREREIASSATTRRTTSKAGPELTIVVPTLNERDNVGPLIDRLDRMLGGVDWEAVFVDDDSADETAEHLRDLGRTDRRIRCIRRFGRRGLSSACIEGILSTSARYIAVIDADLQHDEALLPRMLEILKRGQTDLVVASRYWHPAPQTVSPQSVVARSAALEYGSPGCC
jgi:dolichol-phosphate mannosyltransferase